MLPSDSSNVTCIHLYSHHVHFKLRPTGDEAEQLEHDYVPQNGEPNDAFEHHSSPQGLTDQNMSPQQGHQKNVAPDCS